MKHSVLTIGKISIKTNFDVTHLKSMGYSTADSMKIEPYGSALICSSQITRLGGEGIICSKIGNDFYGDKLFKYCEAENLNTRFLFKSLNVPTASEINVNNNSSVIMYNGAIDTINSDEIETSMMRYPDIALIDMSLNQDICIKSFELAKKYKVRTIANFDSLKRPDDYSYINNCDTIIVDAVSAKTLTCIAAQGPDQCVKICLKLHYDYNPKYVVLHLGERGSIYYDGKHCEFYPGIDSSEEISKLAKYSFISAFALDYIKSDSIGHACMAANIVSGLTSLNCETIFTLPTAEQVNNFVKEKELKI